MLKTKVVILNWNGAELLSRFLKGVRESVPSEVGVIVADNGSTDSSEEVVAEVGGVEWLPLGENYGFAEGYNRALKGLDGDVFVLLNSDVETPQGWLEPLVELLERESGVGAVQPKICSYANPQSFEYAGAAGGFIDSYGYPFCRGRILGTIEEDRGQYDDEAKIFWASGACVAVRAEVWRRCGGLDGDFFAHMEEIDLAWRMQLMGYGLRVEPRSRVYHIGGGTLPNNSPRKIYYNFRNSLCMLHKCLPEKSLWRLRVRMAMDWLSWGVYLLLGRFALAREVRRAHRDYRAQRRQLDGKRKEVWRDAVASPDGVFGGWIVWEYLIGRRRFERLKW